MQHRPTLPGKPTDALKVVIKAVVKVDENVAKDAGKKLVEKTEEE